MAIAAAVTAAKRPPPGSTQCLAPRYCADGILTPHPLACTGATRHDRPQWYLLALRADQWRVANSPKLDTWFEADYGRKTAELLEALPEPSAKTRTFELCVRGIVQFRSAFVAPLQLVQWCV